MANLDFIDFKFLYQFTFWKQLFGHTNQKLIFRQAFHVTLFHMGPFVLCKVQKEEGVISRIPGLHFFWTWKPCNMKYYYALIFQGTRIDCYLGVLWSYYVEAIEKMSLLQIRFSLIGTLTIPQNQFIVVIITILIIFNNMADLLTELVLILAFSPI